MMRESVALLQPDRAPIGSMEPAAWTSLNALLTEGGFIKKPIVVESAYTTQFLPKWARSRHLSQMQRHLRRKPWAQRTSPAWKRAVSGSASANSRCLTAWT